MNPAPVIAIFDGIGGMEMMLIFVISLILFGGKKLPEVARGLGKAIRTFKQAASGVEDEIRRAMDVDDATRRPPYQPVRPPRPPAPPTQPRLESPDITPDPVTPPPPPKREDEGTDKACI